MKASESPWATARRFAVARALSRVPLALLPLVIAGMYGASSATDAFFLVYAGVLIAGNMFAVLETAVVPFLPLTAAPLDRSRFVGLVLRRTTSLLAPAGIGLAAGALIWHAWQPAPPPGWEAAWQHLLVFAPLPLLMAAGATLTGYLNASERFLSAAGGAAIRGLAALVVGVLLSGWLGLAAFAFGLVGGELLALGWLFYASGLRPSSLAGSTHAEEARQFQRLFLSMVTAALANATRGFADRLIASTVGTGAVSVLEYAERLFFMAMSLVGAPYATVLLSRWSASYSGRPAPLRVVARRARAIPVVLGLLMFAGTLAAMWTPLGEAVLRSMFDGDRKLLLVVLTMYFAGAAPYLLGLVLSQALLVLRDARFVTTAAIALAIANVPLDLLGVLVIGLPGIALASSLSHVLVWMAGERRLDGHVRRAEALA